MVDRSNENIAGIVLKVGAASLVVLFLVSVYRGSSYLISKGFDPDHIPCGVEDLKDYPYIYFTNPDQEYKNKVVCVQSCPKPKSDGSFNPVACVPNSLIKKCEQNISIMDPSKSTLVYDTFSYKGNVCIPRTLEYYDGIKDFSAPNLSQQLVSDILKSEYILIFMAMFGIVFSYLMMHFMKKYTKLMIWLFALGVYLLIAGLGIYFAIEWKVAKDYNKETKIVGTFQVSEKYIQELITEPSIMGTFFLMFFFTFSTIYGGWFLYNNYRRVDDIVDAFEIIESFIRDQKTVQQFITYATIIFMILFLILLRIIIQFGSCYQIQYLDKLGPFDHLKEGPVYYIHFIFYPIIFWMIQTYIGSIQYFVCNNFRRWVYTGNDGNLLISTIQPNRALINSQIISQTNPIIIYQRGDFIHLFSKYNQIAYVSLLLVAGPLKFIADFCRDTALKFKKHKYFPYLQKFLCGCFQYYKLTRDIEEVIYMEMALEHQESIKDTRHNIKKYLELSEQESETTIEVFEYIRNTSDFFMLSVKLLVSLSLAAMTRWILTFFFDRLLYSLNGPTLISAILGYYVASVYFSAYQIGIQSLGYLYFREIKAQKCQQLNYFLHIQNKLGRFSQVIQRQIEEQNRKRHEEQNHQQN